MSNIIQINNLNKSFGSVNAVQNLSFRVKKGELFAFLGINGAGKSTTINIMCGQLSKDSGSVFIDKHDLDKDMDYIKRELGVVFQSSVLDSALSVYDNLESRAALYGITGMEFKKRLEELAKILDFENLLKRTVGKLSGGQRRRIDIARALFHKPKILILDEPTAGLDPKGRDEILGQISHLQKETGISVVLVSHSMEDVANYVERIIVMNKGKVMFDDVPHRVFSHVKELEAVGLAAPQVTYILHQLKDNGFDVDPSATTIEEAKETILQAVRKNSK